MTFNLNNSNNNNNNYYEYPVLELYETKKLEINPDTKKFSVSRLLNKRIYRNKKRSNEEASIEDDYETKARKIKLLLLIIVIILLILLTVAILALGISSVKTIECKNDDGCKPTMVVKPLTTAYAIDKKQPNCSYGYVSVGSVCYECGTTFVSPNVRVIGGIKAIENSWPSQVYIVQRYKGIYYLNNEFIEVKITNPCSGTLIDSQTVMTAAHCLKENSFSYQYKGKDYNLMFKSNTEYPTSESMYTVYFGVNDMSFLNYTTIKNANVLHRNVSRLIRHELYDSVNNLNDIALVKLSMSIQFNKLVQPACLPRKKSKEYPKDGSSSYVAGWGATSNYGEQSIFLNNVKLLILPEFQCWSVLSNYVKNWDSQICAGDVDEKRNTCNGDSGAGLFVKEIVNERTIYIAAGIVSMGEKCENFKKFGIYTRTSYYIDWINAYLN